MSTNIPNLNHESSLIIIIPLIRLATSTRPRKPSSVIPQLPLCLSRSSKFITFAVPVFRFQLPLRNEQWGLQLGLIHLIASNLFGFFLMRCTVLEPDGFSFWEGRVVTRRLRRKAPLHNPIYASSFSTSSPGQQIYHFEPSCKIKAMRRIRNGEQEKNSMLARCFFLFFFGGRAEFWGIKYWLLMASCWIFFGRDLHVRRGISHVLRFRRKA